jgi:hypothetical protein
MNILRRAREPALRNSAKCTRNFGRSVALSGSNILRRVAEKWPKRLFTKNIGLCEAVKRCIGTDTCPVPEGQEERLSDHIIPEGVSSGWRNADLQELSNKNDSWELCGLRSFEFKPR